MKLRTYIYEGTLEEICTRENVGEDIGIVSPSTVMQTGLKLMTRPNSYDLSKIEMPVSDDYVGKHLRAVVTEYQIDTDLRVIRNELFIDGEKVYDSPIMFKPHR